MLIIKLINYVHTMKKVMLFLSLFIAFNLFVVQPTTVFAGEISSNENLTGNGLEDYLCNALAFLTGGVGKSLAAFACIGVSLAFIGGKVAWTSILAFALGMACIFGAPQIIKAFAGGDSACQNFETLE